MQPPLIIDANNDFKGELGCVLYERTSDAGAISVLTAVFAPALKKPTTVNETKVK